MLLLALAQKENRVCGVCGCVLVCYCFIDRLIDCLVVWLFVLLYKFIDWLVD